MTGIIKTFADLSTMSSEQAQFVSAGISEALITTEYGLVVAIPAFVAHAILSRRAKGVLSDMEKLASSFWPEIKIDGELFYSVCRNFQSGRNSYVPARLAVGVSLFLRL